MKHLTSQFSAVFPRPSMTMVVGIIIVSSASPGWTLPQTPTIQSGQVKIQQTGQQLNIIQNSPNAAINWQKFSIGQNEGVFFRQPSRQSVILNRVTGSVHSDIAGTLKANGTVLLINPNGILFSPTAKVDVGSILATTLEITDQDFLSGNYRFRQSGESPLASVENFGSITVQAGGFAALVAPGVANHGVIQAQVGQVALGAGTAFTLDFYRDGLISFEVDSTHSGVILGKDGQPITSLIDHSGTIQADGGSVFLTVQSGADILGNLINLDGLTQAQTVSNRGGKIVLSGFSPTLISGKLDVTGTDAQEKGGRVELYGANLTFDGASVEADGRNGGGDIQVLARNSVLVDEASAFSADSTATGKAGAIAFLSEGSTLIGGDLSAAATGGSGKGGKIETSGKKLAIASTASIDVSSATGQSGTWTLDPDRLFVDIDTDGMLPGPETGDFTVAASVIEDALLLGDVELQANDLIQIDAPIDTSFTTSLMDDQTLSLVDQDANGDLTINLNAPITLGESQTLAGEGTTINVGVAANGIAQNAVDVAASDAIVNLAAGTFNRRPGVITSSVINIDKNLTILGQGPDQTILNGSSDPSTRVIDVEAGVTATVENLAVINGTAIEGNGGGIRGNEESDISLRNVRIENNSAELGGGIFTAGKVSIFDSLITGNEAVGDPFDDYGGSYPYTFTLRGTGGGVFGSLDSEINILLSDVTNNQAEFAGGGVVGTGTTTIDQSTIANNTAPFGAGLINIGVMDLLNSTVSGNIADNDVGGILNGPEYIPGYYLSSFGSTGSETFGKLNILNTTISGNEAGENGGGIGNYAGDVNIVNSTITANTAGEAVGGLGNFPSESIYGIRKIAIANSIISGNEAPTSPETYSATGSGAIFESQGFNLVGQNNDSGGFPVETDDMTLEGTVDSVLTPLADNGGPTQTHGLIEDSPAIDAGSNDLAKDLAGEPLIIDQRGGERSPTGLNSGETIDIGAYEATSSVVVTQTTDENTIGNLRAAVNFVNGSLNFNDTNLADPQPNTIRFDPALFGLGPLAKPGDLPTPATIELQNGELTLSNSETPIFVAGPNSNPPGFDAPGSSILTLSGANQSRIFNVNFGTAATLQGLTLAEGQAASGGAVLVQPTANLTLTQSQINNNSATENGGGIHNEGTLTIANTFISGNSTVNEGGGIFNRGGTAVIQNSSVTGNEAEGNGGGVANEPYLGETLIDGNLMVSNSLIGGNSSAKAGGGISNSSIISILETEISGNTASEDGGGIYNTFLFEVLDSELTLANSRVVENSAGVSGGGVRNDAGEINITGSEISGNMASQNGGGIDSDSNTMISNTTISNNSAGYAGGGIYTNDATTTATHVTIAQNQVIGSTSGEGGGIAGDDGVFILNSSIVSGNFAGSNPESSFDLGSLVSNGNNFVGQNGDRGGFSDSENVFETSFEENLSPLADHGSPQQTHALLPGSAALDAAPNLLETDQRGIARPQGSSSDAGAFESQGFALLFEGGSDQSTVVDTDFPNPLFFQVFANDSLEPVEGGTISLDAPLEGASITEPFQLLILDADGIAETTITANTIAGTHAAIAGFGDEFIEINLENLPDVPAFITAFSGTPQNTVINTPFEPLQALVTDQFGNKLSDVTVSFKAPEDGPSANFTSPTTTLTNTSGIATVNLNANGEASMEISGSEGTFLEPYFVSASSGDLSPANFSLANIGDGAPPISPPMPPVEPPSPPVIPPPPSTEIDDPGTGGPVEKVDEELKQTFDSTEPPTAPPKPVSIPTPAIALTPRLDQQIATLEQTFSKQHQQFLGVGATTILPPQDVSVQLKKAKTNGDFNPAVIYTFFAPQGESSAQAGSSNRTSGLLASIDQSIDQQVLLAQAQSLAQAELSVTDGENCLAKKTAQANDPLWQFDTCGWQNFAPSTRPAQASDSLVLLLVTSEGTAIRQVVPDAERSQVLAKVKEFQRSVVDLSVPVSQSQALGQQMYDWIVRPLQEDLEAEEIDNLVFVMDEGLRSMPLAAMHDGTNYLIENYSAGLMPSMSLADTDFISVKEMQVLAMGAEEFQSQSPLPSVPVEISTIAQNIWQGETFLNERFTPQALKTARQGQEYGIVHLATHGEFRAGNRDRSYIQFWDSKVRIDELADLGLTHSPPVSLLVLSACRTALGDPNAELGFTGLAVASGVQTAMGGLWYVSDVGTLGLMTQFYQNLRTAPIKAEALRQAQLSMLSGTTRIEDTQVITPDFTIPLPEKLQQVKDLSLSHPYYWSGITMIGTPW